MTAKCPEPIVHGVGEIAIAFGNLELYVAAAIWQLLGISDQVVVQLAQAITAEMSFDRKVHALASMYKIRFPSEAENEDVTKLFGRLFKVQDLRNQVLHSNWPVPDTAEERFRVKSSAKMKHGLKTKVSPVKVSDIEEILQKIHAVGQEFATFALEKIQKPMAAPTDGTQAVAEQEK